MSYLLILLLTFMHAIQSLSIFWELFPHEGDGLAKIEAALVKGTTPYLHFTTTSLHGLRHLQA